MRNSPSIAKLTRPAIKGIADRERLFSLLDSCDSPVAWVCGPAGSGKTTLAASYLSSRKLPCIWYQVDKGDSDIASFFYYMGLASKKANPRKKRPLPALTPEYLPGIETFTRRYFEEFYSRLKQPFLIVLDNFQEAVEAGFHEVLNTCLEIVPEGIKIIVLSRKEPSERFARLRASKKIGLIGWDKLRFNIEETSAAIKLKERDNLSEPDIKHIHEATDGWAAGIVLMSEASKASGLDSRVLTGPSRNAIFDYFANEIFLSCAKTQQEFLLKTALLPFIAVKMAEELTGDKNSHKILSDFNRNNYFTDWRTGPEPFYQYHPLFREFLLSRAEEYFSPEEILILQRDAGRLLEDTGQTEAAAELFIEIEDFESIGRIIIKHAQSLTTQGRSKTLECWISEMPKELVEKKPWLLYWSGICRMAYTPVEARGYFENAYLQFKSNGDVNGLFFSLAAIVDTFVYAWGDFKPLDHWIAEMETLVGDNPKFQSSEIEARVAASMISALTYRQPHRDNLPLWAERVEQIILHHPSGQLRMMLGNYLNHYYSWIGEFSKTGLVIDAMRQVSSKKDIDQLTQQMWCVQEAMYSFFMADHKTCMRAVNRGLKGAEESGIHLLDYFYLAQGIYSAISLGDTAAAIFCQEKMSETGGPTRLMDKSLYHYTASSVAWFQGDFKKAIEHGRLAVKFIEVVGCPLSHSLCVIELALTLFDAGQHEEALKQLALGVELARGMNGIEFMHLIFGARFAFDLGYEEHGLALLKQGLTLGARQGYVNMSRWNNATMSRLCAKALEYDIEPGYVRKLIIKRRLTPEQPAENWPYPIRINTLGRFELEKDSKPLVFPGRVQQKPLLMLKALIALAGRDVAEEQLTDILWPDADGDAAHSSFTTTLSRLRLLMGYDALLVRKGKVTLNPCYCVVDLSIFEQLAEKAEALRKNGRDQKAVLDLAERAIKIYKGNFLAGDSDSPWSIEMRERLKNRFLSLIVIASDYYERLGQWEPAVEYYLKAVEVDALQEELYRRLMVCYQKLGDRSKAAAVYKQCSAALSESLGISTSAKTEELYLKIAQVR